MSVEDRTKLIARKVKDMLTDINPSSPKPDVVREGSKFVFRGTETPTTFELYPPGMFEDQAAMHWRLVASSEVDTSAYLAEDLAAIRRLLARY